MLETMTPTNKWWALLVALTLGFWAEGAAAQSEEDGWFEPGAADTAESDPSERPQLVIHGEGPYDPPPADFQPAPPSAQRDRSGDEVAESDEAADEDEAEDPQSQELAVREFSPHLAPYGHWVDDPYYGRVWVPSRTVVGGEFRPYISGGHWELTAADEWLWASDYPFGWVTFHYGRWAWLAGGGWGWVPGYVWAPAWVSFRVGSGGYVGWGPLPPYSVWRGGAFVSLGVYRPVPYIFCPTTYVFTRSMPRYIVRDRHRVHSIARDTYRYRPRYAANSVRVRSPSPREARIEARYVPSRRVIAQPRSRYAATDYRRRELDKRRASPSVSQRGRAEPRYLSGQRSRVEAGAGSEPRYRSAPSRSRAAEPRYRGNDYPGSQARDGRSPRTGRERGAPAPTQRSWRIQPGQGQPRQRPSGQAQPSGGRAGAYQRRGAPAERGHTLPPARYQTPPARSDGARYRGVEAAPERYRAPPAAGAERRGEARRDGGRAAPAQRSSRGGPARGGASRDRDDRGRSR
jgi:uncharacterized protein DUF6600